MTYTDELNNILLLSRQKAEQFRSESITSDHFLLAILETETNKAKTLLVQSGIDIEKAQHLLEERLKTSNIFPGDPLRYDKQTERILRILDLETKAYKAEVSDTDHLLMAILRERVNRTAGYLSDQWQISYESMEKLNPKPQVQQPKMSGGFSSDLADDMPDGARQERTKERSNSKTPALEKYGKDLTSAAAQGLLDPVIGRDKETERLIQILSRRKKNNPILIGEPGVGKSAIVEGLALRIVAHEVSPILFSKHIFTLDIASMVAGTTYRGQFEERMKNVITELQRNPDIILFIDEIHTIIGAGNASGSLDAANILKPALARGEVQCIGATTINEYRKSVEKDGALERRFQKVTVEPCTREETLDILRRLRDTYGKHHHVVYPDQVLEACVDLTARYITERSFPDKAIDAMDEVGAHAQVSAQNKPDLIDELESQIRAEQDKYRAATQAEDYKAALEHKEAIEQLKTKTKETIEQWRNYTAEHPITLTEDDVARVVSLMSGVPVQRIQTAETQRLKNMDGALCSRVVGQDEAIHAVVKAIQRSRFGLKDPNRPIGTFFFLGPTGVGKTHLAQCLAEEMFGSKDAIIRFDMSEYMEKHTTSLLVGAPPGYVAHEEGGKLTEAVRRKPYSIVLFDEIEKAHADIFNILLQVLDEGRLTDRQGRIVDFRNTIIILTSNVGTRQLKDFGAGIGFGSSETSEKASDAILIKAMQKQFPPEFVNRIDSVVTFHALSNDILLRIFDLELQQVADRMAAMNICLEVDEDVKTHLINKCDCKQYGARPIKRAIQSEIEDAIITLLMEEKRASKAHLSLLPASTDAANAAAPTIQATWEDTDTK